MIPVTRLLLFVLFVSLLALPAHAADKITFDDHVFSIFESHCLECHNADEAKGGLDLSSYGATMTAEAAAKSSTRAVRMNRRSTS